MLKRILLLACFCISILSVSFGQNLIPDLGEVFKDDVVPTIRLYMPADSLDAIYDISNHDKEHLYPATFEFDNGNIQETLENVGVRLRGNTSLSSAKKSFKISFNTFESGRKFYGLEKLNLNGEHNDPSIIRSKLTWDMCRWMGVPGSRANHVALYINDEYYGLYINIEHIDEEYTQLRYGNNDGNLYKLFYGCDLDYLGMNPDIYKLAPFGNRVYELQNNNTLDDYSDLSNLISTLNNSFINNLPCELEHQFNVDHWLKYLVIHILSGHWDDPILNKNNAYLYHNLSSNQIEYLLYDVDNTFGIDFLNNECEDRPIYDWGNASIDNPLYSRILQNTEYRDRFSFYMQYALNEFYNPAFLNDYLDEKLDMIKTFAEADNYRTLDYGFTYQDFLDSYDTSLSQNFVTTGLKEFINIRSSSAQSQLNFYGAGPGVQDPIIDQINVNAGEIGITAKVNGEGMGELICHVCVRLLGETDYECLPLADDGTQNDGEANDGIFGIVLSPEEGVYEFNLQAEGDLGGITFFPACGDGIFYSDPDLHPLRINEIMSNNQNTIADEFGEYDDWIEIVNTAFIMLEFEDIYVTDNPRIPAKWKSSESYIQSGEYALIWADRDPGQGPWHADFQLSSQGESVALFHEQNGIFTLLDYVDFSGLEEDEAWGRLPDGLGEFASLFPTPDSQNLITSVDDLSESTDFNIFPNPVKMGGIIVLDKKWNGEYFEIVNILGKTVKAGIVDGEIEIGDEFGAGVYYLWSVGKNGAFVVE